MYLRRNDTVCVISGNEKGVRGKVLRVLRDKAAVVVQGVNLRHKHLRRSQKNPQGGRIQKEMPIAISRVLLWDPKVEKPTRIGYRFEAGKKIRYSKKSGDPI
jgi:large subunit ribosomal protein L24